MKLDQGDLVSFLMALAIPRDGKLGQTHRIHSSAEDYLFGWTQTVLHPKGKYSLVFLVSQCITVQMKPELDGTENKGYPMRVHILVSMQRTLIP